MPDYTYVLHDTRLNGRPLIRSGMVFTVDNAKSLGSTLQRIRGMASRAGGSISEFAIMAHGLSGGVHDSREGISTSALGFGLQVCKENITLANTSELSVLDGLFPVIILYACGPANTRQGFAGTRADGNRFCREIAAYTNAEVIAGAHTQWYHRRGSSEIIDFGRWEGPVYRFLPDGTVMPHHPSSHSPPISR